MYHFKVTGYDEHGNRTETIINPPLTPEQEQTLEAIKCKFADDLMAAKTEYDARLTVIDREYQDALAAWRQERG